MVSNLTTSRPTSLSVMVTGGGSVVCLSMAVLLLAEDVDGTTAGVDAAAGIFFFMTPLVVLDTEDWEKIFSEIDNRCTITM